MRSIARASRCLAQPRAGAPPCGEASVAPGDHTGSTGVGRRRDLLRRRRRLRGRAVGLIGLLAGRLFRRSGWRGCWLGTDRLHAVSAPAVTEATAGARILRLGIHDADRRNGGCGRKVDIDRDLAARRSGLVRCRGRRRSCIGHRCVGRLRPKGDVVIEISVQHLRAQIGTDAARIAQQRKRLAVFRRAAVQHRKRMRGKAVAIGLDRAAQRRQDVIDMAPAALGIGDDVGKERQPRGNVGSGTRGRRRRGKDRLLAGRFDTIAGKCVEAGQRRTGRQGLRAKFRGTGFERLAFGEQVTIRRGVDEGPGERRAENRAETTTPIRATPRDRAHWKASAQTKTRSAADPAAIHSRNAEFPMSESTPSITPLPMRDRFYVQPRTIPREPWRKEE